MIKEKHMFGFQGGERAEVVTLKRFYMKKAQERWPFITNFDASTIKNQLQLAVLVKDRTGVSQKAAEADVRDWVGDKSF
jgi:hypothetical protein